MAAEDIVGGLFGVNPAMYQQQQQQQVFNRAVALQNLDPFQQAAVGTQQAGYNLAGALGGALGGVDPQLQRISTLNAISKQIDQTNPESMLQGAKMLADAGFTQEALGLAQYARKANSELALAEQRRKEGRAAGANKDIEIAEYSANIKNQLGQLQGMEQTPEVVNAIALLQNRLDALPKAKEGAQNAKIAEAQRAGQITSQLAVIRALPKEQQSEDAIRTLETELAVLNPTKADSQNSQIAQALRVGELTGQVDILQEVPEAQQNKPLIKRLQAELLFLTKGEKVDAGTTEFKNATTYANSLGLVNGSPEWQKAYADKFAELIAGKTAAADKANIAEIGVSPKGDAVYFDKNKDEQFIVKIEDGKTVRVPYAGSVNRATSNVSATATSIPAKQQGAFAESRGRDQAASLKDAAASALSASQALKTISTMKQLDQTGQLVTGPLANSYVGASNLLASIGLLSKNQISILTSSQIYDKSAKDLVMQDLGGKLGAQISDADRKFVEDRIPQLTTSAKARTELLEKIEEIQRGKIAYYKKMEKYANKEGDLNGFDFSEVYTVTPPVGSPAASATKRKADAIIKGEK